MDSRDTLPLPVITGDTIELSLGQLRAIATASYHAGVRGGVSLVVRHDDQFDELMDLIETRILPRVRAIQTPAPPDADGTTRVMLRFEWT